MTTPDLTDAACRDLPARWWHPDHPGPNYDIARRICRRCPVTIACLRWAMSVETGDDRHGMFGGLTPAERAGLASRTR